MDSTVIWIKDVVEYEDFNEVLKDVDKSNGIREWTVLSMGKPLEVIKSNQNQDGLQEQTGKDSVLHPIEFLVDIYRHHCSKNPPFCRSIYGLNDQLVSLQLVMAQHNKQCTGQFEADIEEVISNHQQITKNKLENTTSSEMQVITDEYNKFLEHCNAIDYADVVCSVKDCIKSNQSIRDEYAKHSYIVYGSPTTLYEIEILRLLIGTNSILLYSSISGTQRLKISFDQLLDQSIRQVPNQSYTPICNKKKRYSSCSPYNQATTPLSQSGSILSQSQLSQGLILMGEALSVFMSYLQLMVNSRDELALARVINTPSREIGIRQFNKIKQVAKEKNMTMFQMVMSFILQIRLGGKSYAPSSDNPMRFMAKGLGEFVSFFQKLQNIIEEVEDPRVAVTKIINTLQSTFIKSKTEGLSTDDIRKAGNFLKTTVDKIKNNYTMPMMENKSCMLGLKSYVLLCRILDKNIMYDYQEKELYGVLTTPRRSQGNTSSMLSKFRTPEAPTPQKDIEIPNIETPRVKGKTLNGGPKKRTSIWQDYEPEDENEKPLISENIPASKKRPFECGTKKGSTHSPLRKRPCESLNDQENVQSNHVLAKKGDCTVKKGLHVPKKNSEAVKKRKPQKKSNPVKKLKGQQQLTCFFR